MQDIEACHCPFCGSTQNHLAEIEPSHGIVECEGCGAIGPAGATRTAAVAAWNRRVRARPYQLVGE